MKFDVSQIFVNLHKAAITAIEKKNNKIKLNNSLIVDDKVDNTDGEKTIAFESKDKIEIKDAHSLLIEYMNVFAGKEISKKIKDSDLQNVDGKITFSYKFKTLDEIKESKINIMKNKVLVMEADAKPTFEISPNELVGKLHQAAMDQVDKKYGNVISLFNTAIDTNQDPPIASLQDGMFKIKMKLVKPSGDKKRDKQTTKDALKLYLTWFAGKDVATAADKPKWFIFKSKLDKGKEKNADGTQGYSIHYKMKVEKVDAAKNEKKADADAAKESIQFSFVGGKTAIVECSKLATNLKVITESEEDKDVNVTEKDKKDTSAKESGFIINTAELIGKLHEAAMQAMTKKYGKNCTIVNTAIDEDHKPPLCTTKPGQYKIIVKQLKKGLFGSTKAAKEAIRLYLTTFAGEDVAKDILKAKFFIFGKSKFEKGKHEGQAGNAAGFSVYYQLDMAGGKSGESNESIKISLDGTSSHIVECNQLYRKVMPLSESYKDTSYGLVKSIMKEDNIQAQDILEKIVAEKVGTRMKAVLEK